MDEEIWKQWVIKDEGALPPEWWSLTYSAMSHGFFAGQVNMLREIASEMEKHADVLEHSAWNQTMRVSIELEREADRLRIVAERLNERANKIETKHD